jgi:hypothetical protein
MISSLAFSGNGDVLASGGIDDRLNADSVPLW